jgi:peptidoglycan/LPS O-acetylase OafA/YrhL
VVGPVSSSAPVGEPAAAAEGRRERPSVAPPPGHPRFPLFDALRAIAVMMVFVHHCAFATGLMYNRTWGPIVENFRVSLPIFFLTSAFLLYRPFVAERYGGPPPPKMHDFARRRAVRILPGYWLALTLLAIYPGLVGVFTSIWWVFYGLLQGYPIFTPPPGCAAAFQFCGINQAWSLTVDVAFYAALPLYVILGRVLAKGRSRKAALTIDLTLLAILAVASVWAFDYSIDHFDQRWLGFNLPGTFVWLACGMALAVISAAFHDWRGPFERHPGIWWAAATVVFLVLAYVVMPSSIIDPRSKAQLIVQWVTFGLIATLIAMPAVFGDPKHGLTRKVLAHPWVSWLGIMAFGIYLYQVAVILKLHEQGGLMSHFLPITAVSMAITIPIAALSYYLLERPVMKRLK